MPNHKLAIIEKRVKRLVKNVFALIALTVFFTISVIVFVVSNKTPFQAIAISLSIIGAIGIIHRIGILVFCIKSINRAYELYCK